MAFLNIYDKQENYSYSKSIKSGDAFFFVGKIGNDVLVLKTDSNGAILWEYRYIYDSSNWFSILTVTDCDNGDIIVSISFQGLRGARMFRIDSDNASIVWSKSYNFVHGGVVEMVRIGVETYLLMSSARSTQYGVGCVVLFKLDYYGDVILTKLIGTENEFPVLGTGSNKDVITYDSNYIYLIAPFAILKIDFNLNPVNKFMFEKSRSIHNIRVKDEILQINASGIANEGSNIAAFHIMKIPFPNTPINQPVVIKVYLPYTQFSMSNDSAVYRIINPPNGLKTVQKIDLTTNTIVWTKNTGINSYARIHVTDEDIIYFASSNVPSESLVKMVGVSNLDFENCKATSVPPLASPPDLNTSIYSNFDLVVIDQVQITVQNVNQIFAPEISEKIEQCTFLSIPFTDKTMLQSAHLYMQAAGSEGIDSTKGIHLRWTLKNGLANHLPKADYATGTANFNKPDDYVKIYRAPYEPQPVTVDLGVTPDSVNDTTQTWVYTVETKMFYVYFSNANIYTTVRVSIDPVANPSGFITSYMGSGGVIEVENKNELAFAAKSYFSGSGTVSVEFLSVEENKTSASKLVTFRKILSYAQAHEQKYFSENIRSVRFKSSSAALQKIEFEFYSDYILFANSKAIWDDLGEHALTLENSLAHERLEPQAGLVHGAWRRYNDGAFVNVDNYKTKWDGTGLPSEERIKNGIAKYIEISNAANNPMAIEEFSYDPVPATAEGDEEASTFEISNLFLLQVAALDYHVARMMGLGILDTDTEVNTGQYIYVAHYKTFGNLKDGLGAREVNHLYVSLPTGLNDQRLPIPVDLQEPKPGIYTSSQVEMPESITDADGYTPDGKARFLTLYNEDLHEEIENAPFFYNDFEFISSESTIPVYAGIEYKKTSDTNWKKPELSFNGTYQNIDSTVTEPFQKSETVSIIIPDPGDPLFIHREKESGWHDYSSYGINWFSRATSSPVTHSIETEIVPVNIMLPPGNLSATLIQSENPLLLTSAHEQLMLENITADDKTLIRLTFDYNHAQELISYHEKIGNEIVSGYSELSDNEEPFAEFLDISYRNRVPGSISGKVQQVQQLPDFLRVKVYTAPYLMTSTAGESESAQELVPEIPTGTSANYIGSVMLIDQEEYIIDEVDITGAYPAFTVWKRKAEQYPDNTSGNPNLASPGIDGIFLIVENMQSPASWDTSINENPLDLEVLIDHTAIHRETVITIDMDGEENTYVHKFRGIYRDASIKKIMEEYEVPGSNPYETPTIINKHLGLYEITFTGYTLPQHNQFAIGSDSVEFHNGIVRIHTLAEQLGKRKELNVIRIENIGVSGSPLKIYAYDPLFPSDGEVTNYEGKLMIDSVDTITQKINYYPGYKVYLYADPSHGLTQQYILPEEGENIRYSIFGLRSFDSLYSYYSKFSAPALMFARRITEPQQPEKPQGGLYATRSDFFGKSTYTFTTEFQHIPHSIQFGRASDIQILSALYNSEVTPEEGISTLTDVKKNIFEDGEEESFMERWENLLSFDYPSGNFATFPPVNGVALPLPDNPIFITAINNFITEHNNYYPSEPNVLLITEINSLNQEIIPTTSSHGALTATDFLKEVVLNCFVPLTEVPVIFQHIKGNNYIPVPKKQIIRDRNGNLMKPDDPNFDMAPMMKVLTLTPKPIVQFTDFGLDGASRARYFYTAKEINLQMKTGDYSVPLGPVTLVNTSPPPAPEVVRVLSVLENQVMGIEPAIRFQINAFSQAQGIEKIRIYRTNNKAEALSVRSMQLVKTIDIEEVIQQQNTWVFDDDFSDLPFVPYGDILYYRITVLRKIKYNDSEDNLVIDHTPSEASELIMTNVVNNRLPDSPQLTYDSDPLTQGELPNVVLAWEQTVYNGKYHVYKMNAQGNWVRETEITSNQATVNYVAGDLIITDQDDNPIYHHFKVVAENFSGMLSTQENILTITGTGIGFMTIGNTFVVS